MVQIGLGVKLDTPALTTPIQSLLTVATEVKISGTEWMGGGRFVPQACCAAFVKHITCEPNGSEFFEDPNLVDGTPKRPDELEVDVFYVYQPLRANTVGFEKVALHERAEAYLEATTAKSVEYGFWTGVENDGVTPAVDAGTVLTDPAVDVLAGGVAQTPFRALQSHIQYLATCGSGGRGMIHATPSLVFDWWAGGHLRERNGKLETVIGGHYVVSGSGYTGSAPGNVDTAVPENEHWSYATGMVMYALSDVFLDLDEQDLDELRRESIRRQDNSQEVYAKRVAMVWRDPCCHHGALADITLNTGAHA